jgi:predicted helicase
MGNENIALLTCRQQSSSIFRHVLCANIITEGCSVSLQTREITYVFPLFLYPDPDVNGDLFSNGAERHVNLNPKFIGDMEKRLKLKFIYDGKGNLKKTFGPEDVFNYIYAVFHSPTYRERYKEFLKIDFPRVPLTSDITLFRNLCSLGAELVSLHILAASVLKNRDKLITRFPQKGDNLVEKGYPKYDEKKERVCISRDDVKLGRKGQYFERVPMEVWNFYIGGYQVCHKWLKDRQGRKLSDEEISQYPKIVMALFETICIMKKIDDVVPEWPII